MLVGVVYYELLPENQIIDVAKYCEQLDRLREIVQQKRQQALQNWSTSVIFHHDNARPHTFLRICEKLL